MIAAKRFIALIIVFLALISFTQAVTAKPRRVNIRAGVPSSETVEVCIGESVEVCNESDESVGVLAAGGWFFPSGIELLAKGKCRVLGPFKNAGSVSVVVLSTVSVGGAFDAPMRVGPVPTGNILIKVIDCKTTRQVPSNTPDGKSQRSDFPVKRESGRGLDVTTFQTPWGSLVVYSPESLAAGDTFLATVERQPLGRNDEERARSLRELNNCTVAMEGLTPLNTSTDGLFQRYTWTIPSGLSASIFMSLKLSDGRIPAHIEQPIQPPPVLPCPLRPLPGDYGFPTIGQPGRPLEILGPFPWERFHWRSLSPERSEYPDYLDIKIGGESPTILAMSPRECIVENPANVVGPTEIVLKVGDVETRSAIRNIAVRLTATKTELETNETAVVTCEASELGGAQDIQLQVDTTGAVTMEGGNSQAITVHPADYQPGGTYTFTRTIKANEPGGFQVTVVALDACGKIAQSCQAIAQTLSKLTQQAKGQSEKKLAELRPGFDTLLKAYGDCLAERSACAGQQMRPSPTPQPSATPQSASSPTTPLLTNKKVTAASLEGQTVHIEGDPRPGVKGLWLIKIKTQSGETTDVFIASDKKPELKFCDWIKVGKAHDGFSLPVVDSFENTEDPNKKPATGPKPGDTKAEPPKPTPSPEAPKPPEPPPSTEPSPTRPPDVTQPAEEKCKEGEKKTNHRVISCEVSDAVATQLGYDPTSKKIFNIGATILRVVGAGRGVGLGKLLASAFSSNYARHLYIKLKIKYVDETWVCKNGKWVLESSVERESETGWIKLFDSQGGGGDQWLPGSTGGDVEAAISAAKAGNGCP